MLVNTFLDGKSAEEARWPSGPICPKCGCLCIAYVFVGLFSVHRVRTKSVLRQGPLWNTARFHAPSGFERSIE